VPTTRCPSADQLELLLEDQLQEPARQAVSLHVGACAQCQAALERLTEEPAESELGSISLRARTTSAAVAEPTSEAFLSRLKQSPPPPSGAPPADGAPLAPPGLPTVPGYEILGVLGRGGMGVVYKARQVGLNRLVALKMILAGAHVGPKGLARFLAEAEAVARLRHPNIVQIYDIGETSGSPYFALEFVEGGSLARRLGGPQPVASTVRMVETLARSIHFAHENGIVHRDLKPSNILLQRDEGPGARAEEETVGFSPLAPRPAPLLPKITDFGLAKRLNESSNGTQSGEVVGTPSYMAPEQAAGKISQVGPATDVYALGAILYELLTGRPPFKGATPVDTVVQVLHEEPGRPSRLRPDLPRDLEIICLKCLEKEPAQRYASAEDLADDLRRFRQGKPIEARPVSSVERAVKWMRRHPLTAALLAAVLLVTVLGFVGVTSQWRAAGAARDVAVQERRKARAALYYSRIAQSQLQWRVNDVPGSHYSLEKCKPQLDQEDRRGWEWYYLRGLFHADLLTLRHRHGGAGGAVAYRPDGRWIASVVGGYPADREDSAGEVRIWDAASGSPVRALAAPGTAHRLAFSPDGARLALAGTDGSVLVWDPARSKELLRRAMHGKATMSVAFSPDNLHVASGGWDGLVKIWDSKTGRVLHTLKGHAGRVQAVAYDRDGCLLASAGWDATVRIWDTNTGKEVKELQGHLGPVYAVAFSPYGRYLASAGGNGSLKIWAVQDWRPVQSVTGNAGAVLGVAFSPDGRSLAYGGGDATVRVWDVEHGVERFIFRGHTAPVESVQFSPDGLRLVSASPAEAAAVKVWDLTRHPEYGTFVRTRGRGQEPVKVRDLTRRPDSDTPEQSGPDVEALAFDARANRLLSVTVGGTLQSWDAATGVLLGQHTVPMSKELVSPAVLAAFSPNGEYLAARFADDRSVVKVWEAATGAEVASLHGHTLPVSCVRFSPHGARVVTCACDPKDFTGAHEVKVWGARDGKLLASLSGRGHIYSAALSPDGRWLALALHDGTVFLVDWAHPRRSARLGGHKGPVGAVAFSPVALEPPPDASCKTARWLLASAGVEDRKVHFWDVAGLLSSPRKPAEALQRITAPPLLCDLAFSPDGKRLAGVSRDVAKMWDATTGHEVLTLRGAPQRHWDPAFNPRVLFSPDGKRLAATNWDETISVWEADAPEDRLAELRQQRARRWAAEARAAYWHLQEAEECLEHNNPAAAQFHLGRLGDARLSDPLQARKERLIRLLPRVGAPGK
jgi:WD40 repeat protein/serine/threonine protein kinase